jgi:hypothetical protein
MAEVEKEVVTSRGHNFSPAEKEIVLALDEGYRGVIECKRTDTVTTKLKDETWRQLAEQYNSKPTVLKRSAKQLRLWWDNQKKRSRSRMADNKVKRVKTGGGPCDWTSDVWDERVASISAANFEPLVNAFDSDAAYYNQHNLLEVWGHSRMLVKYRSVCVSYV